MTERYRSLAPMYYRGAAAAIVVYDITKKVLLLFCHFIGDVCANRRPSSCVNFTQDSFNGAKSWVKELQRRGDPNVVIALAGNKADMEGKRKVQTEEAQQYALENDIIFLETSAKTALNVRNLFVEIGKSRDRMYFTPRLSPILRNRVQKRMSLFVQLVTLCPSVYSQEATKGAASGRARVLPYCASQGQGQIRMLLKEQKLAPS